jgi:putative salt-induced outer membrane protein YdiY
MLWWFALSSLAVSFGRLSTAEDRVTTYKENQLEKVGQGTKYMQRNAVRFAVMPPKGPLHTS